ncbi:DNA replication factor Cdt1 [Thelohanellus kitauei]|uniref:DNA replication factor Cdt1 n=1 Tax=Thelohanellus kitauei TaxID=669202 RepID=A0A0C2MB24_THEKT|nr:DNA replication factor Cdt1 [Thelohanellus kitauei]
MPKQSNIDKYFRSKRIPGASPAKKKSKTCKPATPKLNLSLAELFTTKATEVEKPSDIKFISTGPLQPQKSKSEKIENDKENVKDAKPAIQDILDLKTPSHGADTPIETDSIDILKTPIKNVSTSMHRGIETSRKRLFSDKDNETHHEPAYKRFAHLCEKVIEPKPLETHKYDSSVSLYIPQRYQRLYDIFVAFETVIHVFSGRNENCTFDKVKNGVECMTRMQFTRSHLAQILHIMGNYYSVYINETQNSSSKHELVIERSENTDEEDISVTTKRRKIFYDFLLNAVHAHHSDFLAGLGVTIDKSELKRWHPKFRIEEVPEIETATLPEIPKLHIYTAKDMLRLTCFKDDEKLKKALKDASESKTVEETTKVNEVSDLSFKHVSKSLLEKIRLKERQINEKKMLRDPKSEILAGKLQKIPEIMRCVYKYFISELAILCLKINPICQLELFVKKLLIAVFQVFQHIKLGNI